MATGSDPTDVPALEWREVTKIFGTGWGETRVRALAGLTLTVPPGRIVGLLGANGGGKSTAIKVVLGLLEPTAGSCRIMGRPSAATEARQEVGYLPESPQFHSSLTGFEVVDFAAELCGCPRRGRGERVKSWLDRVGLADAARRRLGTYSRGMLQRVGLAQALVHEPRVLILDEPTSGVDPAGTELMHRLLLELKREGRSVLLTSHLVSDWAELCDDIAYLVHGRLARVGPVESYLKGAGFAVDSLPESAGPKLQAWARQRGGNVRPLNRAERLGRALATLAT